MIKKPSEILSEYASLADQLGAGQTRLTLISEEPFVAVGVEGGTENPFTLALPENSAHMDERSDNLRVVQSREIKIRYRDSDVVEFKVCTTLSFRSFTPAAQILLDVLVATALESEDPQVVGELTQDFIDLFKPVSELSFEELLGLFGELFVIWNSKDPETLARSWHQRERDQYDFALDNDRIEVKITTGPDRRHRFSSSQIPPREGMRVAVVSMITDQVSEGRTVVELYENLLGMVGQGTASRNLAKNFSRLYKRGEDLCENTMFDWQQAEKTLLVFDGYAIPSVELNQGVVTAKWEADLEKASPSSPAENSLAQLL